ncbi:UDP-glucose 4-epimerase [Desulfohalotomaculum tongense]|uniref:UDP-glucose 4-epimerase GalE n=1 Tax=Desulforadius tongensis TaxID=1216062 RepID=UPI00195E9950|nr:UDP-glucose 4-epimerase GalE [Desulforadius tongensis]MBM7853718.1 UDP-glucose 4-epimerase [Desulforadius tongensis]
MTKKILVAGGAGYIGSHTCKVLAEAGYEPVVYDNLVYGHREFVKWGPFEEGDLLDRERLNEVFKKYCIDSVMHFAAFSCVGESVENPIKYYRNNVTGTINLLEAAVNHGVLKVVFSSTCSTYGNPVSIPIDEQHPQVPINPYGMSKLMVEKILDDFDSAYKLKSVKLRYFNAAGADPSAEIGEKHNPETHLIPVVLDAAAGRRPYITIFGTDYDTKDGTCIRDFIHVNDLADAHLLALQYLENGGDSEAFNLGNGQGYSVKEVIYTVQKVTGQKIKIVEGARRPGDPPVLVGSSQKIQRMLKWAPQYNDLEIIIEDAWRWHKKI